MIQSGYHLRSRDRSVGIPVELQSDAGLPSVLADHRGEVTREEEAMETGSPQYTQEL